MTPRDLIKGMTVIGGGQIVQNLLAIVRLKVVALIVGAAGVGVLGLFSNVVQLGSQLAGLGLGSGAVREIALQHEDQARVARLRRMLVLASLLQGGMAIAIIWLLRAPLSEFLSGDRRYALEFGLLGTGIFATVLAQAYMAYLQGVRRLGAVAKITVWGNVIGSLFAIAIVWRYEDAGLIWVALALPVAIALAAFVVIGTMRLERVGLPPIRTMWRDWRDMIRVGASFLIGGLVAIAVVLLVRAMIVREIGLVEAGLFHGAWVLAVQYLGILQVSMGADYYPSLTRLIGDRKQAVALANQQAQIGLAVYGPLSLLLIALAPWFLELLYGADFTPAATLLQWLAVANIFRLTFWPVHFIVIALGRPVLFLAIELLWNVVFVGLSWLLLARFGLEAVGLGFFVASLATLITAWWVARRIYSFTWERQTLVLLFALTISAIALFAIVMVFPLAGAAIGMLAGVAGALMAARMIARFLGTDKGAGAVIAGSFAAIGWPIAAVRD